MGPADCCSPLMPRYPVTPGTAASGSRCGACALVLVVLSLVAGGARAELLGTHPHRNGTVHLMTDLCRGDNPSAGQRARQTVGGRERQGCWGVNRVGNPVVTWSDGSELELDGDKVRLSRRMAGLLEEPTKEPPTPTARPRTEIPRAAAPEPPSRSAMARRDFVRPAWCPNAHYPHERLVCTDAELADRDLRLASLWRPYRSSRSPAAVAWHKSDYFRRLKRCGADKACIFSEQETQMRRYREGLPSGG